MEVVCCKGVVAARTGLLWVVVVPVIESIAGVTSTAVDVVEDVLRRSGLTRVVAVVSAHSLVEDAVLGAVSGGSFGRCPRGGGGVATSCGVTEGVP